MSSTTSITYGIRSSYRTIVTLDYQYSVVLVHVEKVTEMKPRGPTDDVLLVYCNIRHHVVHTVSYHVHEYSMCIVERRRAPYNMIRYDMMTKLEKQG